MPLFSCTILTLYPEMFPGPLGHSLAGRALEAGLWRLETVNIRDFATDKHHAADDTPYGGGAGMVMKPDVLGAAIDAARSRLPDVPLVLLSPRGELLTQALAGELAQPAEMSEARCGLILICGRFEGVDERVVTHYRIREISVGDYVLLGGEVAAMALLEAMLRLIPGVLGNPETTHEESFDFGEDSALLLEYPHYTRPPCWQGLEVPGVLTSGDHAKIAAWRRRQAEDLTRARRPDIWRRYTRAGRSEE